jgi:DNA-binding beta-propeller fold protein YncE
MKTLGKKSGTIVATLFLAVSACGGEEECNPGPGQVCTVVGTGVQGFAGDLGAAKAAELYLPMDVTMAPDGTLFVVDWNNHRLRAVAPNGTISTFAGTGLLGDGPVGKATESDFNHPTNVTFDPLGRMVIAAWHNSRIKRIDVATATLEEMCGTGKRAYAGDGGLAADADLDLPASVAFSPAGELHFMDQANQVIRKIDGAGMVVRVAGMCVTGACMPGEEPEACPMNSGKTRCPSDPMGCAKPCAPGFAGDGGPALAARMAQPFGQAADPAGRMVFDATGNLYFADTSNHRVRKIDPAGVVTTIAGVGTAGFAGDGGPALAAQLNRPVDVDLTADGTLLIADTFNSCVRALAPDGVMRTFAGVCGTRGFAGDGGPAVGALFDRPYGVEVAPDGKVYVTDTYNSRIRLIGR